MEPIFSILNIRARELGLSHAQIARLSKLSLPTIKRVLSGRYVGASFATIQRLAASLGLTITAESVVSAEDMREKRARHKAEKLIKQLQGTSALEGQALTPGQINDLTRKSVHELLAGSSRHLWAD